VKLLMTADEIAADRAGWLKRRQGDPDGEAGAFVGASDVGKLVGAAGARGSAFGLWAERTGQFTPDDDDLPDAVEFGTYCEPFTEYLLRREQPGWHITPGGLYASDTHPWATATFDRMMHPDFAGCPGCEGLADGRPQAPVQLKNSAFADWAKTGPPEAYVAQVIWEAFVMGARRGYLVAFDRNAVKIATLTIEMNERALASLRVMIAAAERFRRQVADRTEPDVDGHEHTTRALKQMAGDIDPDRTAVLPSRLAARWFAAITADDAAEARRRLYLNQCLQRAGNARTWAVRDAAGQLVPIATVSAGPRAGHWVKPSSGDVMTVRPRRAWDGWKETR
jgi:predicted phage-related endonuclease